MTTEVAGFGALAGQQYINLTTFRKSGEAVKTPVWFAEHNGKLYMLTIGTAGKVKRIRANHQVRVGPCDARGQSLGPELAGRAQILSTERQQAAIDLLNKKYGLIKHLFDLAGRLTGSMKNRLYIEIEPE